ncbi:hypothetical protein HYV81_06485 [Candidatus Woesearchaeota archaeon]|nr:hypothetical protein [Candidatus Woesearchaeota archaeon]
MKKVLHKRKAKHASMNSQIPIKVEQKHDPVKIPETRVEVSIRKKIAGQAPEEYHFVLADGKKLKDMLELVDSLEHMSDEIYRHHANEFKNDFSTWLRDIFDEHELADEIAKIDGKLNTQVAVMKHLLKKVKEMQ